MAIPSGGTELPTTTAARRPRGPSFRPDRVRALPHRVVVGLVAAVIGITASSAVTMAQGLTLPAVTGTAAVGRVELALNDAGRPDPFATDGRARELAVSVLVPRRPGIVRHGRAIPAADLGGPRQRRGTCPRT